MPSWIAHGRPMPMPPHMKVSRVKTIARILGSEFFVETGTYRGDTSAALSSVVQQVLTVEISETLARRAEARFSGTNVTVLLGDSARLMAGIVERAAGRPTLYWLDGHFSAGVTGGDDEELPLEQELITILPRLSRSDVVLIDDVREFGKDGYPTIQEVEALVMKTNGDMSVKVVDDMAIVGHSATVQKLGSGLQGH